VACPASVLVNWIREITARSTLRPHRIHGAERSRNLNAWIRAGGGAGYLRDFPVERMMRNAKIARIRGCTDQIERIVMAEHGPHRRLDRFGPPTGH